MNLFDEFVIDFLISYSSLYNVNVTREELINEITTNLNDNIICSKSIKKKPQKKIDKKNKFIFLELQDNFINQLYLFNEILSAPLNFSCLFIINKYKLMNIKKTRSFNINANFEKELTYLKDKISVICPFCGSGNTRQIIEQKRALDEAAKTTINCDDCGKSFVPNKRLETKTSKID